MLKIVTPNAWNSNLWNEETPRSALIKRSSRGVIDRQSFIKRACSSSDELLEKIASMDVKPGEELIHLIALGTTETYGPNRNGDGFSRAACEKYHPTFAKHARFYRDHKNTDPKKSYGIVKASALNRAMDRVELIVALNGTKQAADANGGLVADKEMEKLASHKDLPVSMACLTNPEYPILTKEHGYIPIKEVCCGLHVWTKDSGWKPVVSVNRRRYTGNVYELSFNGLSIPLEVTADHPLWVKRLFGYCGRAYKSPEDFERFKNGWVLAENINITDRVFYKPIDKYTGFAAIDDEDLAAVLGYYTAEGCVGLCKGNGNTVSFICNLDDSLPRRIPEIFERMYPDITVNVAPHRNSKYGLVVTVYSAPLAKYINTLIGRGCRNKIVPPEIFNARDEVKKAFIGAWIDGDGCADKKGCRISTASCNLALQARDLLASIGIPSSIYKIDHSKCATSGMKNSGIEYTVNISHIDVNELAGYSSKIDAFDYPIALERTKPAAMRKCSDGMYAYRIKDIQSRYVEDIEVYNFEVEDDPSYSAAGIVSHNCSVPYDICSYCGNKAETQDAYCLGTDEGGHCKAGGLRHNMGKIASVDGKLIQLYADNTKPDFFDISHVFIPADRIAYSSGVLTKSASFNDFSLGGAELARRMCLTAPTPEIRGFTKTSQALQAFKSAVSDFHSNRVWEKRASFLGVMSFHPLHDVEHARRYKFAELHRALVDEGICLSPSQFVQLASDLPIKKAALLGEVIAPLSNDWLEKTADFRDPYMPSDSASADARQWVRSQGLPSIFPDRFLKQAAMASIETAPEFTLSRNEVYAAGEEPDIAKVVEQYAMYKLAFVASLPAQLQETAANLITGRDYMSF